MIRNYNMPYYLFFLFKDGFNSRTKPLPTALCLSHHFSFFFFFWFGVLFISSFGIVGVPSK